MHDIKFIRQNPEAFDAGLARRGLAKKAKVILELDQEKRKLQTDIQEWQSVKNKAAKDIGLAKAKGDHARAEDLMLEQKLSESGIKNDEQRLLKLEEQLKEILETLPNLPAIDVPDGSDEHGNKQVRIWGEKPSLAVNKPKLHDELGVALGMMDFDGAAKLSGARFVVLKGALARMERALANFMLDVHTNEFGYTEHVPPLLVRDNAMYGTGQLPKFEDDLFRIPNAATDIQELPIAESQISTDITGKQFITNPNQTEWIKAHRDNGYKVKLVAEKIVATAKNDFWLIPTAEVPLTNLAADAILDEEALPMRMTAYTPCFRSEAGAAGKDTRGMIRQHQFSKVELVSIVHPDKSQEEHERMTACAEEILKRLGLHYRVMLLCTGDMGFCSEKTYDLEVWMPGQDAFREISSCSNCGAFQARRMKARFKGKNSKETQFVHTLNGSGLAIGRTMVAILENYQNADGSIRVPDALKSYMGGLEVVGIGQ